MTRKYSPNHPSVMGSPHVMTEKQWSRLYRKPLTITALGFVVGIGGVSFMPGILLYGYPIAIVWGAPGFAICMLGFKGLDRIYRLERSYDK